MGLIASFSVYESVHKLILAVLRKSVFLRRNILGLYFIEGTWVGKLILDSGEVRYTVEYFNQKEGRLTITGYMFDQNKNELGSWSSKATQIDLEKDQLFYAYSSDMIATSGEHHGVGRFGLIRGKNEQIIQLHGYSSDLPDGVKDPNHEFKVSEKRVSSEIAFDIARRKFLVE